jgi:hypothetical protein
MATSRHAVYSSKKDTPKLRFNTKNSSAAQLQAICYIMNSVVSSPWGPYRQGRGSCSVGRRQVDLPFLVPHPAREDPVRSGHADLHPGYQIHMLNSSLVNKLEFQSTC